MTERKTIKRFAAVFAIVCVLSLTGAAATLSDYAGRVRTAMSVAFELGDEVDQNQVAKQTESARLDRITAALPEHETIDLSTGTIETDNAWLHKLITEYRDADSLAVQQAKMNAIRERLSAIEHELTELEDAAAAKNTKDEDKQKLGEILRRDEYRKPEPQESVFQRWMREFMEWLSKMFPRADIQPSAVSGLPNFAAILQVLLYVLVAAGIGFVLYKLLPHLSDRFKRREGKVKTDRVILGERVAADESSSDLFEDAEALARQGETRLAIRKGYIALLCELADRKIIGLARHKTNRDYLRDVRKRERLFEDVRGMTGEFERHWYGTDPSEAGDWERFRTAYRQAVEHAVEAK